MYSPEDLLGQTVDESMSTRVAPVPEGEYTGVVGEIPAPRMVNTKNGEVPVLDIPIVIDAPGTEEADGRSVRYTCWLDVDESGKLDTSEGKNTSLGRIRAACNQNATAGWSISMLSGNPVRVTVRHNHKDDATFANIAMIAAV